MKNNYSPKPLATDFTEAFATAQLFPTHQEVCHRNARRGLVVHSEEVTGTQEEMVQQLGYDLLASIHAELHDHPEMVKTRNEEIRLARERVEKEQEQGLTTEINTNSGHIGIRDTLENCAAIIGRHPYGYNEKWTEEENKEAAEQMAAVAA